MFIHWYIIYSFTGVASFNSWFYPLYALKNRPGSTTEIWWGFCWWISVVVQPSPNSKHWNQIAFLLNESWLTSLTINDTELLVACSFSTSVQNITRKTVATCSFADNSNGGVHVCTSSTSREIVLQKIARVVQCKKGAVSLFMGTVRFSEAWWSWHLVALYAFSRHVYWQVML